MNTKLLVGISFISLYLSACTAPQSNTQHNTHSRPTDAQPASLVNLDSRILTEASDLSEKEALGKLLFFDTNLSEPAGQSCASCHSPQAGFADPDQQLPVSEGVIPGNFGMRNALSASYVGFTPDFTLGETPEDTLGGQFWDGRKFDLVDQAKAPFLNPLEMNNPSFETVVADVMVADYADLFLQVYGDNAFDDMEMAYEFIADAIATFERSEEMSPFTAKYDLFKQGILTLSDEEMLGLTLFTGKAQCAHCHILNSADGSLPHDLFTDFKFANIGLPRNVEFPYDLLPSDTVDKGLGAITENPAHDGKFKTPHLRNVYLTAPYMHNGLLKTLEDVVHFYNTRDIPGLWPDPEVPENMVTGMVGDLGLSADEEEAIVEFLETLTDIQPISANTTNNVDDDDSD